MVERATVTEVAETGDELIDAELNYEQAMLDEILEFAPEWDALPEADRVALSLDWDQAMGWRLRSLDSQCRHGRMTAAQATRFRDFLHRLKAALPMIRQLRLFVPPLSQPPAS